MDTIAERAVLHDVLFGFAGFFAFAVLTILQRHFEPAVRGAAEVPVPVRVTGRPTLALPAGRASGTDPPEDAAPRPETAEWIDMRWGWHGELNGRTLWMMQAGAGRYRLWLCYVDGTHIGSYKTRNNARAAAERAAHAA
ncbi:hypothetical protein DLJ53_26360 [Acuticoccus sediminis]|uniref:Uncharacterized protein n=1 Tax=Acuticoccus sediminis TaxID=2184697 RepID=A0A8B2NNJ9_9HYPH|nr:hypothetical protein DLJ53_26360 [Acuticoccus sediminis]